MVRALLDRIDPYLPVDILAERYIVGTSATLLSHPTPHPPTLGLLLLPWGWVDYRTAAALWLGIELACLFVSVHLLARLSGARLSGIAQAGIGFALLIWHPVWMELAWGQLMLPIVALVAGAWLALSEERHVLAGVLLGVTLWLKPVALPLLLLCLMRKDWRALGAAIVTAATGYLAVALWVGFGVFARYFTTVLPEVNAIYRASWGNISVTSLAWRVFVGTSEGTTGRVAVPPLYASSVAASLGAVLLPGLLLLTACVAAKRLRSLDWSFALMAAVCIILGPISWPHYLVLAIIPVTQVARALAARGLPVRETNGALFVAMLLAVDWLRLANAWATAWSTSAGVATLPFALAQVPLLSTVTVLALMGLLWKLGQQEQGTE